MPGPATGGDGRATLDLTVAGVCLAFGADDGLSLAPPAFEYPPFLDGATATPVTRRIPIRVSRTRRWRAPRDATCVFDTGDGWRLLAGGRRRVAQMPDRDRPGRCAWQVGWTRPMTRAHARVDAAMAGGGTVRHLVQYPLDQILLCEALLDDGGLLVHAAGGITPAGGLLFAGVSGAGKSTVTRALDRRAGYCFASDDRLFVRAGAQGFELHGTPWPGDAGVARALGAPLRGICFLRKHRSTHVRTLDGPAALERLLPVATLPWFDRERVQRALDLCAALIAQVPCYELRFTPEPAALHAAVGGLARAG